MLAQLGRDRHRRNLRDAAQRLQAADHFLHRGRSQLDRLRDRLLQPHHPLAHVLDLVQIIQPRRLLRHLRESAICRTQAM